MDPSLLGINHSVLFPFWARTSQTVSSLSAPMNSNAEKEEKQSSFLKPRIPHLFFPSPNMPTVYLENAMVQLFIYLIPNIHVCSHPWDCTVGGVGGYEIFSMIPVYLIQIKARFLVVWHNLIRTINFFHSRTKRHSTLSKRSLTHWITLDFFITICYPKKHCSKPNTHSLTLGLQRFFRLL